MTVTMVEAIRSQARGCAALGSPRYASLLEAMAVDWERSGLMAELLPASWERPAHDAVPLRLLAAIHRIVLAGRAPALARFYPSAGGTDHGDAWSAFLAVAHEFRDEIGPAINEQVQTNEIGRAAALAGGFVEAATRGGLPIALREVGASGGLNLRWDRYAYDTGRGIGGDPNSPVRFENVWGAQPPDLSAHVTVIDRRGCDISPIDASSPDGARRLESFVWPDHLERLARLRAALAIAAQVPVTIDKADAGEWVASQVATSRPGVTTVVFHSIVLQYLPTASRRAMRDALVAAGSKATPDAPIAWFRMEPAGAQADLRLTWWAGGEAREDVVGTCGYHGAPVTWTA
jgi:hypothetical protein